LAPPLKKVDFQRLGGEKYKGGGGLRGFPSGPRIYYIQLLYNANQRNNNYNVYYWFPDPIFFDECNYD
jgi:hypothetical protein